jgi:hypothetical protein
MKRNKWMRIASVLLVAALISTCAISGTFAKYVTEDSAYDSARVAKFGVTVLASGKLFADSYKNGATNTPGEKGDVIDTELSVVEYQIPNPAPTASDDPLAPLEHDALFPNSERISELVAPGTKNEKGLTFTIAGKPEVDTKVVFGHAYNDGVKVENAEIVLKKAELGYGVAVQITTKDQFNQFKDSGKLFEYVDDAFAAVADTDIWTDDGKYYVLKDLTKEVEADYKPVAFQLKVKGAVNQFNGKNFGTLKDIEKYFKDLNDLNAGKYEANTDLADVLGQYNITWKWEYVTNAEAVEIDDFDEDTDPDLVDAIFYTDRYDTILGNLIALATDDSDSNLGYKVVKIDTVVDDIITGITEVKTNVFSDDSTLQYYYAYTGDEPEVATAEAAIAAANVAVLTTAFGMNVRVTQLD